MTALLPHLLFSLRLVAIVLATGMIWHWHDSFVRTFRGVGRGDDGARAIWVTMAAAVLLLQSVWLLPGLRELTVFRIRLIAQVLIIGALMSAIYHHNREDVRFDLRTGMVVHLSMLLLAFVLGLFA